MVSGSGLDLYGSSATLIKKNSFEMDMELSLRRQPDAEMIYREILPVEKIQRFPKESPQHILDRRFAIDVVLELDCGLIFTVQEKFRRYDNYKKGYRDFTLEYMSNAWGTKGEYFKLCTDLYCYAWENEDMTGFVEAKVFYVAPMKRAIADGRVKGILKGNNKHSTANFYAYSFKQFDNRWFLYQKRNSG